METNSEATRNEACAQYANHYSYRQHSLTTSFRARPKSITEMPPSPMAMTRLAVPPVTKKLAIAAMAGTMMVVFCHHDKLLAVSLMAFFSRPEFQSSFPTLKTNVAIVVRL